MVYSDGEEILIWRLFWKRKKFHVRVVRRGQTKENMKNLEARNYFPILAVVNFYNF